MNRLLVCAILALYPRSWRNRYGSEMHAVIRDLDRTRERSRTGMLAGLVANAARERMRTLEGFSVATRTSLILVTAGIAAVVLVVAGTSNPTGAQSSRQTNAQLTADVSQVRIDTELRSTLKAHCTQATAGKHVTAIEMNPRTGAILGKTTKTCTTTA